MMRVCACAVQNAYGTHVSLIRVQVKGDLLVSLPHPKRQDFVTDVGTLSSTAVYSVMKTAKLGVSHAQAQRC